jgi:tetratricopeptide (TPR) repeat protein
LAVHFEQAREYRKAVQYHGQAGENALERCAYGEAIAHCQQGLNLLERLPETPERQRQELALRTLLSPALTVSRGFMAEELQNLTRARALCHLLNDDTTLVSVLVGLSRLYYLRAAHDATEQLMDEKRRLLERIQEPRLALQLHTVLGTSSMVRGALVQAQQHHTRVLDLYNPQWHRELVLSFGTDPMVVASVTSGWSLWLAGWPDQACARGTQGLSRARELGHLVSLAYAFIDTARVQLWCGNLDEAERRAEEGVRLAHEHSVVWFTRAGEALQGAIRAQRREAEVGLSMLRERISQYRSAEALVLLPLQLAALAEAYRRLGRTSEGLATIAEAVHTTETSAAAFWAAEVYRLKGELLLQSSVQRSEPRGKRSSKPKVQSAKAKVPIPQSAVRLPPPSGSNPQWVEAESCFQQAIAIARQQGAKSLELRATMSLTRLWQQQGKGAEGHKLLSKIHGWFSEGFATKDLREAKALLAALG